MVVSKKIKNTSTLERCHLVVSGDKNDVFAGNFGAGRVLLYPL